MPTRLPPSAICIPFEEKVPELMVPPGEAIGQSLPRVEQKRDLLPAILEVEKCRRVLRPGEDAVDRGRKGGKGGAGHGPEIGAPKRREDGAAPAAGGVRIFHPPAGAL